MVRDWKTPTLERKALIKAENRESSEVIRAAGTEQSGDALGHRA